jgi:hypothetical protein
MLRRHGHSRHRPPRNHECQTATSAIRAVVPPKRSKAIAPRPNPPLIAEQPSPNCAGRTCPAGGPGAPRGVPRSFVVIRNHRPRCSTGVIAHPVTDRDWWLIRPPCASGVAELIWPTDICPGGAGTLVWPAVSLPRRPRRPGGAAGRGVPSGGGPTIRSHFGTNPGKLYLRTSEEHSSRLSVLVRR